MAREAVPSMRTMWSQPYTVSWVRFRLRRSPKEGPQFQLQRLAWFDEMWSELTSETRDLPVRNVERWHWSDTFAGFGSRDQRRIGRVQMEKLKLSKKRTQPSIDDLMNSTPKSKQSKQKFDANLDMLVLHYCDEAAAYGVEFGEGRLFFMQMATCARPDPLFMFLGVFRKFIEFKSASDVHFPGSLASFQIAFQCKLVYAGRDQKEKSPTAEDFDDVGFVLHRTGFYVNEEGIKNLLMILDEFMQFRMTYVDDLVDALKALPELHIYHPFGSSLDISQVDDEMACNVELHDAETYTKMLIFDMHPPSFLKRLVTCMVELQSPFVYDMSFGGGMHLFATNYYIAGPSSWIYPTYPSDTYPEFFEVVKDISFQDAVAKFKSIHSEVLSNSPVLVRTNRHGFDAANVIKFMEELSVVKNVKIDGR